MPTIGEMLDDETLETLAILADPDAMYAIEEAQELGSGDAMVVSFEES